MLATFGGQYFMQNGVNRAALASRRFSLPTGRKHVVIGVGEEQGREYTHQGRLLLSETPPREAGEGVRVVVFERIKI